MAMTNNVTYSYRVDDAKPTFLQDGLTSLLTGLGGNLDPSRSSFYTTPMMTRDQIDNSYRTSWLSAAIHDAIPVDSVRNWRTWSGESDDVTKIEREERRLGVKSKLVRCETLSRLYGGAVMMLGVRNDDPAEPLDVNTVKQGDLKYIHTISRHEINVPGIVLDPGSPRYGEPTEYQINAGNGRYARVDASRIIRFIPKEMPEHIALSQAGWGDPLLYSINQSIMDADQAQGSFSALVTKARTDSVTIPNLIELASTQDGEAKLKQRIQLMKAFEGIFNTRILAGARDSNGVGESWDQFQVNFANMPEMQTMFWQAVAGASGVPLTRLLGTSPAGLNATGESDTAAYYELISARQEMSMRPRLEMLDEVLLRSATGKRDENWWFTFSPLAVDSAATKATTAKTRADAIKALADSMAVPEEVLTKLARGQIIDSGDYPGAEDAYREYDEAGEVEPLPNASDPANDNTVLAATTEGLVAQGRSASVAARDARVLLADAVPMPLYVSRPLLNGDDLVAWARDNGLNPIDPSKMHVTVAYSRSPLDWMQLGTDDWSDEGGVKVLGGPRMLDRFGPESKVIVLTFSSSRLGYRHEEILRAGASWDWPEYQPHVTIDYDAPDDIDIDAIKPFAGELRFGVERFEKLDADWNSDG